MSQEANTSIDVGASTGAEVKPAVATKKLSRGEQTRRQILAGAIEVLAEQGYRALTHRAIAQAAGVNLSLTTYHFKDLEALINEAFSFYKNELLENFKKRWDLFYQGQLQQLIEARQQGQGQQVAAALATYLCDAILEDVKVHPQGVAVEMTFHFDLHLKPEQRAFAYELCHRLYPQLLEVYRALASAEPETDAMLLLDSVHFLRFRKLAVATELSDDDIYRRIHRLLQLQLA